jgi:uncharacterized membrane protein YfcA
VVIDYNCASVMLPTVLMGSYVGVLVNIMFPSLILEITSAVILVIITIHTGFKARSIYRSESQ